MDFLSLVAARARGRGSRGLAGLALGVVIFSAGCHSGSAGNRPTDAAVEATGDLSEKLPAPDVYCSPNAPGGGSCPLNFCGQPKTVASLAGAMAQLGADEKCTPGYVCVPDAPTMNDTALQLRCVEPLAGAAAFGAACSTTAGGPRCKSDALCIEAPGVAGAFCSQLCRSDRDCPTDAYCLERKSAAVGTSYVNLAYCTPKAKITATPCATEATCGADQGCVSYGPRTELLTCQKVGGTKALGAACTAGSECRSGECFDRAFQFWATGHRAFCSGRCTKSSDCAPDQRCTRIVLGTNGTPADPFDDVVAGYCQSMFTVVAAEGCASDDACAGTGGDTCDTVHGLCYKAGAGSGAACTTDEACALGAVCMGKPGATMDPRFPGGYCQTFGCAPGQATGVDSCPGGAEAACVQNGVGDEPLYACYEGCTKSADCGRVGERYVCQAPIGATAPAICMFNTGN